MAPVTTNQGLFWRKVDKSGTCWEWRGKRTPGGYGIYNGRTAHRVMFELIHGPVPSDLHVDHVCRNRGCVYPGHLRTRTITENTSDNGWRDRAACLHGHPYTPENTHIRLDDGRPTRICRACRRERQARIRSARKL